jgi:hypothetical protein
MTGPAPGWRRLAAGAVDYGIVAAYLALLGLVGVLGRAAGLLPEDITTPGGRIVAQLVVIAVLTLPVTGWFAWWEAAPATAWRLPRPRGRFASLAHGFNSLGTVKRANSLRWRGLRRIGASAEQ